MRKHYISPKTQTQVISVSQLMAVSGPTTIDIGEIIQGTPGSPKIIE